MVRPVKAPATIGKYHSFTKGSSDFSDFLVTKICKLKHVAIKNKITQYAVTKFLFKYPGSCFAKI